MSDTLTYKIADHITLRSTNKELKMLFDRKKGVMYELNEAASSIMLLLQRSPNSVNGLIELLIHEYDVQPEDLQADVRVFIADFEGAGLITVVNDA